MKNFGENEILKTSKDFNQKTLPTIDMKLTQLISKEKLYNSDKSCL